jgi:hypothetical protein
VRPLLVRRDLVDIRTFEPERLVARIRKPKTYRCGLVRAEDNAKDKRAGKGPRLVHDDGCESRHVVTCVARSRMVKGKERVRSASKGRLARPLPVAVPVTAVRPAARTHSRRANRDLSSVPAGVPLRPIDPQRKARSPRWLAVSQTVIRPSRFPHFATGRALGHWALGRGPRRSGAPTPGWRPPLGRGGPPLLAERNRAAGLLSQPSASVV